MRLLWTLAAYLVATAPATADPFAGLLEKLPETTNAIALIDIRAAYASPLGRRQNWAERHAAAMHDGFGGLPPTTEQFVEAALFNLELHSPAWTVTLSRLGQSLSTADLAKLEAGSLDQVAGETVILSPRGYVVLMGGRDVGMVSPPNRQLLARWIRQRQSATKPVLSAYLQEAALLTADHQVVMAMDLSDAIAPNVAARVMSMLPVVRERNLDPVRVGRFASGARGITFAARITDTIEGRITVEFLGNPTINSPFLQAAVLQVLEMEGVPIEEMNAWRSEFGPTTMTLTGPMSEETLRRIVSLFALPTLHGSLDSEEAANLPPDPVATRRYIQAVQGLLQELRATRLRNNDYNRWALVHENTARKIDELPRRGVDPLATAFSERAASIVRAIAASLRGVPIQTAALEGSVQFSVGSTGWGGWGWGGGTFVDTNLGQMRAQQVQVIAQDEQKRNDAWRKLDDLTAQTRRDLSAKFRTEF